MTARLEAAVLHAEALALFGELGTILAAVLEDRRNGAHTGPDDVVAVVGMPAAGTGRTTSSHVEVLGQTCRVIRTRHRRGRPSMLDVGVTFRQLTAILERLRAELGDLAPPPPQTVDELRTYLESLTPAERSALHRQTFPEDYAE